MSDWSPELTRAVERVAEMVGNMCDWDSEIAPALAAALRLAKVEGMVTGHANGCSGPDCPYVYEHGLMLAAARAACEAL